MTESEPTSVFRRFPWVQLVFCLACVGMAGWLWLRLSYCHEFSPGDIPEYFAKDPGARRPDVSEGTDPLSGRYVRIDGTVKEVPSGAETAEEGVEVVEVVMGDATGSVRARLPGKPSDYARGPRVVAVGRLLRVDGYVADAWIHSHYIVDTTYGRLHDASIAGLVVGAMGMFIFGLYLRRWLLERKARGAAAANAGA